MSDCWPSKVKSFGYIGVEISISMSPINVKISLFAIILIGSLHLNTYGQCNPHEFADACKAHLNEEHFNFLKEFPIQSAGKPVEYAFVLAAIADYEYYFTGDNWNHETMVATVLGPDRQELASNVTGTEKLHYIKFHPEKTGIYYIRFTFSENESFCGTSVLGFHKHTKE